MPNECHGQVSPEREDWGRFIIVTDIIVRGTDLAFGLARTANHDEATVNKLILKFFHLSHRTYVFT